MRNDLKMRVKNNAQIFGGCCGRDFSADFSAITLCDKTIYKYKGIQIYEITLIN